MFKIMLVTFTSCIMKTVSVLGQEKRFTVKYGLSLWAQPIFYRVSRLVS